MSTIVDGLLQLIPTPNKHAFFMPPFSNGNVSVLAPFFFVLKFRDTALQLLTFSLLGCLDGVVAGNLKFDEFSFVFFFSSLAKYAMWHSITASSRVGILILTIPLIQSEMEKTLQWLVPFARSTIKALHGFGWVGKWANTGSDGSQNLIRIETLHHADKAKTEAYILDLVVWPHQLTSLSRTTQSSETKSLVRSSNQKTIHLSLHKSIYLSSMLAVEDQEMLCNVAKRKFMPGISKSLYLFELRCSGVCNDLRFSIYSHILPHEKWRLVTYQEQEVVLNSCSSRNGISGDRNGTTSSVDISQLLRRGFDQFC
ncbi:hypothetical protein Nepgr_023654 [Nepenthes gracilis]|uniref:Uncharacterized protein n=1 Tax=Nepenthes gracilis TaxID=150966 RepID=A0AAD3XZM9_NEPGR|nr:hypothetical protein Nepgr_023654 [Nepenthes gracilis]